MAATRRVIRQGELLSIKLDAIQSGVVDGQRAAWWDSWTTIPPNERVGDGSIAVVHVRGALDHHSEYGGDSYDSIRNRVREALFGTDAHRAAKRAAQEAKYRARWAKEDGEEPPEVPDVPDAPEPPACVVLRFDSPGGVVSGLNETVYALRDMFATAGIPSIAYVDELCASAAFALACSCDEIIMPPAAIAGSVGVISCMYDQVEADKKAGINVVTITSGKRKADGHPHVPVSTDAIAAERDRVDRSARAFYRLVSEARGLAPKAIKALEAGIFQGPVAVGKGLADDVMSWDALVAYLSDPNGVNEKGFANGGQSAPMLTGTTGTASATRIPMRVTIQHRVKSTKAALAKATDPKQRKSLAAALAQHEAALAALGASQEAAKKTKIKFEKTEEESEEESESEESEESEAEEESEGSEEEESGNETDRKEEGDAPADDDDAGDDDDDEAEEEEESKGAKKAKAALALLERQTGKRGSAAIGAAAAMFAVVQQSAKDVAELKAQARTKEKSDLLASAKRYVPTSQLTWLKTQPLAVVRGFVTQARKGAPIVHTEEGELLVPKAAAPGTEASLSKDIIATIDAAMVACPPGMKQEDFRARLVEAHLADHKKRLASANGAGRV